MNGSRNESNQVGFDLALRYANESALLRDALGIDTRADVAVHALAQGEHNSNFWFAHPATGIKYVLRINYTSQLGLKEQAAYEFQALEALRPSGRTPLPLFCDETRTVIDHGVLVESFCEGHLMEYTDAADMRRAAAILADVHAVKPPVECGLIEPTDPLREQMDECARYLTRYRDSSLADESALAIIDAMFARADEALESACGAPDSGHILNTEGVRMHFLLSDDGGGYMVDWEKPILGEVAQDIAYFLSPTTTIWDTEFVFSPDERARFLADYWKHVDDRFPKGSFDERFPLYVMTNCLRGMTWSANAMVDYADPDHPLKNERTRKKLGQYVDHRFLDYVARTFFEL